MQACLNELDYKNARVISDGHSKLTVEETDNLVNGICKDFYSKKIFTFIIIKLCAMKPEELFACILEFIRIENANRYTTRKTTNRV